MDLNSTINLRTGNEMPVIGLGTWQLTENTAETIKYAIEIGYRMIDTSSDYGSQPGIGKAIRDSGVDRESLYIVTKVEETDDAYQAAKDYLGEMGLDYADLVLIHRPPSSGSDVELWKGLIRAQQEGWIKDIGVSNYSSELTQELIGSTNEVPAVNQVEWSPFGFSNKFLEYCQSNGIVVQAYSPLTRTKRLSEGVLSDIAEKYDKTPVQVLIRWNLQRGTVPLPKANQKQHLEENINVFDFEISQEDIEKLNDLNEGYSSLGTLPYA